MNGLESIGFIYKKNFIDPLISESLSLEFSRQRDIHHIENKISLDDKTKFGDRQTQKSYVGRVLPMFEKLLLSMTSSIEDITEKKLFPTYSYARIYYSGAELKKHLDRSSCEYSVTVCLQNDLVKWPLCILDKNGVEHQIVQMPGDAIIYKGCEQPHWREVFTGTTHSQVFLHYVDQNGPYFDWKYDKRQSLNINSSKIN